MSERDYLADAYNEILNLHARIVELEEKVDRMREELRVARERKVEETDEGVPPEETAHQDRPKQEETAGSGLNIGAIKREVRLRVKHRVEPKKPELVPDVILSDAIRRESTAQPQSDDDDVIIVDSPRRSPGKRKVGDGQQSPRPPKRQMFWVEVPPHPRRKPLPASVKVEESTPEVVMQATRTIHVVKDEPDQEMNDALAVIRNTSLKKDQKSLDDVSVFTRLSRIGLEPFPIAIADEIKDFTVARLLLSQRFGGTSRGTFPLINKKRVQKHGFDNFIYANLTLHPHAPSFPGSPGLWINCNDNGLSGEDMRLVVRVKVRPLALWQYMGQYDIQPSDPLSLQEWTMQSELTKKSWAKYIHRRDWGGSVRARIQFRKRKGRGPTEQEEAALGTPDPEDVTAAEIREALDNGEERLYTWTLKCRGYDERFQREILKIGSEQVKEEEDV